MTPKRPATPASTKREVLAFRRSCHAISEKTPTSSTDSCSRSVGGQPASADLPIQHGEHVHKVSALCPSFLVYIDSQKSHPAIRPPRPAHLYGLQAKMDAGSIVALFLLVSLFALWIVVCVHARERLSRTRRLGIGYIAAQDIFLTLLAVPSISAVSTIKTIENLQHHLWQTRRSLYTAIRSLCKALVRYSARKWYWFSRHSARTVQQNDLEMSRSGICDPYRHPRKPSTLLQIPAEIREIIIRMSVVHYDILDCRPTILLRPRKQFRDVMALIRTCRQLCREARRIVLACTLFHVWTRRPFYRQLKPAAWNELTMIHLAAQFNSQHTSRLAAAIWDLNHMAGLRDIYISIWNFIDFEKNEMAVASVFGPLRNRLRDLSLVQVSFMCPRTINHRAERRLKTLIMAEKGPWPVDKEFGLLRSLQGPVTKWRAFIKLQGYETKRAVDIDEDLVALPWDGEHV